MVCYYLFLLQSQCPRIGDDSLKWVEVFFMQKNMMVKVADKLSRSVTVTSGVPQGLVLDPLLFMTLLNLLFVIKPVVSKCFLTV